MDRNLLLTKNINFGYVRSACWRKCPNPVSQVSNSCSSASGIEFKKNDGGGICFLIHSQSPMVCKQRM